MDVIKRIIKLSKSIALRLLNEGKDYPLDLNHSFSHNDTKDIIENLTSSERKKEREKIIKHINKTKQADWKKINSQFLFNNRKNR